jgi:hypothetical protein
MLTSVGHRLSFSRCKREVILASPFHIRKYGTFLMISEFTLACLTPGRFKTFFLDKIKVDPTSVRCLLDENRAVTAEVGLKANHSMLRYLKSTDGRMNPTCITDYGEKRL